ncbi:hypothetical protein [Candidatus Nitrosocosmicus sp. R]
MFEVIGKIVNDEQNYSQLKLTKSDSQINYDIFSIQKNLHIMKDFKDMTLEEKEEILEQIRNFPEHKKEDGGDSFDLFNQSFSEISKTWSDSLKEFEALYPDYLKDENTNPLEKYESRWTAKIRKKLF